MDLRTKFPQKISACALFVVMNFCAAAVGFAQVETVPEFKPELARFYLDALSFFSDTAGSRLDVYLQVPYQELHFLKEGESFVAKYEVTVSIISQINTLAAERSWTETVTTPTFDETIAPRAYSLVVRSFLLTPSKYLVRAQVRDHESRMISQIDRDVKVRGFTEPGLTLSDVMIVKKLTGESGKRDVVPNISANLGESRGPFYLFFEVYNRTDLDTLLLKCKVYSSKDKSVEFPAASRLEPISRGRNQVFFRVDSLHLPVGSYDLVLEARKPVPAAEAGEDEAVLLAIAQRPVTARWFGAPNTIADLDQAIEQLEYLAKDSELGYVKEASTLEEKQQRFMEFWKKKDPTPGTEENEAMEEYYGRIQYANEHFKHYVDGWKTDRGMVFIIFGAPSNVDRHPFDFDSKPYEIWYYYDQNRRFVFMDQTGFGDYRLLTPLSEVWRRR